MAMLFVLILLLSLRVVIITCIPADTRRLPNVGLILAQRRRQWVNINPNWANIPCRGVTPSILRRIFINPLPAVLFNFIFCPLESGSRYRDPQLKMG